MSHVTNVILSYSVMEEEEERLAEVNAFFNEREGKFDDAANDHYGGSKFIERPTYVGAFNFLRVDEFVEHVRACKWDNLANVQLFICGQHEDRYTDRLHSQEQQQEEL